MNKPIDLSSHPILQQAFDVIQAIEKCGASVELTNAVTKAGELMTAINEILAIREMKGSLGFVTDWEIDHSVGVPILVYKKCSVIESEQAYGLLNLIKQSELKGDQVPVSMDSLRDAVAEMSGGLPMEWKEGNDKGHHAVPFINFNSLHRIVTKFTAPQKPVVLSFEAWCKSKGKKPIRWVRDAMKEAYDAAIEAAGGIVKDGE